tara:strand:+ start:834 stop:3032 length:2199 start_codon:yes stop_codon:yes gene_type:complete
MASKDSSTFYPVLDIGQGLDIPDFSKIPKKDWKKVVDDLNKKQAEKYKNLPTQVLSSPNANLRAGIDYKAPEKPDKEELAKKFADSKRKETMMMVEAAALPFTFSGLPLKAAGKQVIKQGDNMINLIRNLTKVKSGASKVSKTPPKTTAPAPQIVKGGGKPQDTLTELEKVAKQKGVTKQEAATGTSKKIKELREKKVALNKKLAEDKKKQAREAADKAKSLGDSKPQAPTKKATNEQINRGRMAEYEKKKKEVQAVRKKIVEQNKYNAKVLDEAQKNYKTKILPNYKNKVLPQYKKDLAAYNKRKADMEAYKQAVKENEAKGIFTNELKRPAAVGKPPVKPEPPKPPALGSQQLPRLPKKPDQLPPTPKAKPKEVKPQEVKPQEGRPQTPINEGKQPTKVDTTKAGTTKADTKTDTTKASTTKTDTTKTEPSKTTTQTDDVAATTKEGTGGLTQEQMNKFFPPAPLREATEEVAEGVGKRSFNPATNEGFGNITKEVGKGAAKVGGKVKEGTKAASDVAFKKVLPTTVVLGGGGLGATGYMLGRGGDDETPKPKEGEPPKPKDITSNKQKDKKPSDTVVIGTTDAKQTVDTKIPLKDTELSKKKKSMSMSEFLKLARQTANKAAKVAVSESKDKLDPTRFDKLEEVPTEDPNEDKALAGGVGTGTGTDAMSFRQAMDIASETKEREMLQNLGGTTPTGLDYLRSAPEVEAQNVVRRELMERERKRRKQKVA